MNDFTMMLAQLELLLKNLSQAATQPKKERFGHEFPVGTVLVFHKKFPNAEKRYTYAALRAATGEWYLTGAKTHQPSMNWQVLCMFIGDSPCAMPTSWVDL